MIVVVFKLHTLQREYRQHLSTFVTVCALQASNLDLLIFLPHFLYKEVNLTFNELTNTTLACVAHQYSAVDVDTYLATQRYLFATQAKEVFVSSLNV